MKGPGKVVQRKGFRRGVAGCERDRSGFGCLRQTLHHALEARAPREAADIGFPTTRKRLAAIGRLCDKRAFPRARRHAAAGIEQLVGLRNGHQRAAEALRQLAHRREPLAGKQLVGFNRLGEAIGELHVQGPRIALLQLQRF